MLAGLRGLALLAALSISGAASAAETVFLPDATAFSESDQEVADSILGMISTVLQDNDFVIIDSLVLRTAVGDVLDACPRRELPHCTQLALRSLPARVGVLLRVDREGDNPLLVIDFFDQEQEEPIRQAALPIHDGNEQRVALQVTMFVIDVFEEIGESPPELVEAARRLREETYAEPEPEPEEVAPVVVPAPVPQVTQVIVQPDALPAPAGPTPEEIAAEEERLRALEALRAEEKRLRHYARGSLLAYEHRDGEHPMAWIKRRKPHADRFLIELSGGGAFVDVNREALILGASDGGQGWDQTWWREGPTQGAGGRMGLYLGYAPTTIFDLGVTFGFTIYQSTVSLGFMATGEDANTGDPQSSKNLRFFMQPRFRLYTVPLGVVKPYFVVGAEVELQPKTKYTALDDRDELPIPTGGWIPGVIGGFGVIFDVHYRVGVVVEGTAEYQMGNLSGIREDGVRLGRVEPAPVPTGWTATATLGVQVRI